MSRFTQMITISTRQGLFAANLNTSLDLENYSNNSLFFVVLIVYVAIVNVIIAIVIVVVVIVALN